jgi:RNA 2',3'-cyclic 3'-phosphodiesterase
MQYSFDYGDLQGGPHRPKYPERLIYMLRPELGTAVETAEIGWRALRDHQIDAPMLKTDRLHVSLQHVGDYKRLPTKIVFASRLAGAAILMKPFAITFRAIKSFEAPPAQRGRSRRWPVVLLCEGDGLHELHGRLGTSMATRGLRAGELFVPHMTLFYAPQPVPFQLIEPIRFVVTDFELIHSRRGLTEYRTLDQWMLER